jgi:hypothetical protein
VIDESRAKDIIEQQQKLRGMRSNWDNLWQEIADRVWPQMADFVMKRASGEKRTDKIFDSTAPLALDRGSAAFHSLIVPDSGMWHGLAMGKDQGLMENVALKGWLDEIRKVLFALRRSPRANFSGQAQECIKSLLGFGTLCMFTEDVPGRGIRYKSIHLAELDVSENKEGMIDTVYRRFEYSARQAVEAFGVDKLPPKIKDCYEKKDEASRFEFIHYVAPNDQRKAYRRDMAGMRFKSCYVSVEGKGIVEEGGYRRFPYHVSRYATNPREVYGRGPAILLLPDIKMLNEQEKTRLRAGHLAVDPPLLLFEDGALQGFQMRPRALNYGGVNEQGQQLVVPLQTGANLPWATELLEERRKLINEGFWLTLFQILVENPKMTATEAMLRAQEKGQLLAPPVRRQESEWLGPMVRREIDIAAEMGLLPPPPEEVLELLPIDYDPETGFGEIDLAEVLDIEYTNPLARLVRSEDSIAILRTFEQLAPMAEIDPTVYDEFHPQRVAAELAEINGVPAKVRRTDKEKQALQAGRDQAAQAARTLEAAPVAASAAKDLAQAAATAGSVPGPIREFAPA